MEAENIGALIEALHEERVQLQSALSKQEDAMGFLRWLKQKDLETVTQAWKMYKEETKQIDF